jgi:GTPase SAR1 family protein
LPDTSMRDLVGRRTLIVGDVGAGKTRLTRRLLEEALELGLEGVTVIEMAPRAVDIDGVPVGGALVNTDARGIRYLQTDVIKTPRLSARTPEELLQLADHNREKVERLLEAFDTEPSSILFINDVSIYLQRGSFDRLWETLLKADTVVANGYVGERLKADLGTGLSRDERQRMDELASRVAEVIRI